METLQQRRATANLPFDQNSKLKFRTQCEERESPCLNLKEDDIKRTKHELGIYKINFLNGNRVLQSISDVIIFIRHYINFEQKNDKDFNIYKTLADWRVAFLDLSLMDDVNYRIGVNIFYDSYCMTPQINQLIHSANYFKDLTEYVDCDSKYERFNVVIPETLICETIRFMVNLHGELAKEVDPDYTLDRDITMQSRTSMNLLLNFLDELRKSPLCVTDDVLNFFKRWLYVFYGRNLCFVSANTFRLYWSHISVTPFGGRTIVGVFRLDHPFIGRLVVVDKTIECDAQPAPSNCSMDCGNDGAGGIADHSTTILEEILGLTPSPQSNGKKTYLYTPLCTPATDGGAMDAEYGNEQALTFSQLVSPASGALTAPPPSSSFSSKRKRRSSRDAICVEEQDDELDDDDDDGDDDDQIDLGDGGICQRKSKAKRKTFGSITSRKSILKKEVSFADMKKRK